MKSKPLAHAPGTRLTACALAFAAAAAFLPAASGQEAPAQHSAVSQAGYVRFLLGDLELVALSDGTIGLDPHLLHANESKVQQRLRDGFEPAPVTTSVNAYLFRTGDRVVLVDAGAAGLFGPTLGKLPAVLKRIGIDPGQVTDILITHIHTDHSGGLMDGDRRVYPNATIHIERKEVGYWMNPDQRAKAPDAAKVFFDQAVATVGPYIRSGQVRTFDGATDLLPGVRSVPAPGHTPGHSFYELVSKGQKLLFWGDVLHVAAVQFPEPGITIQYDVSPEQARTQREQAFARAAREGYLVAPAHVNFPGIGRLRHEGDGYRWYPAAYANGGNLDAVDSRH